MSNLLQPELNIFNALFVFFSAIILSCSYFYVLLHSVKKMSQKKHPISFILITGILRLSVLFGCLVIIVGSNIYKLIIFSIVFFIIRYMFIKREK